jgi:hypothetical protein
MSKESRGIAFVSVMVWIDSPALCVMNISVNSRMSRNRSLVETEQCESLEAVTKFDLGQKRGDSSIVTFPSTTTYSDGSQICNVGRDSVSQKMSQW